MSLPVALKFPDCGSGAGALDYSLLLCSFASSELGTFRTLFWDLNRGKRKPPKELVDKMGAFSKERDLQVDPVVLRPGLTLVV